MRTVKEISDLTGISVRTLHYYDEIGLLKPTEKSDAQTFSFEIFHRKTDIKSNHIVAHGSTAFP